MVTPVPSEADPGTGETPIDPPIPPWCFEHQAYNCPHTRGERPWMRTSPEALDALSHERAELLRSEAATPDAGDVEAVFLVLLMAHRLHPSMNICTGCDWRATPSAGSLADQHARHLAAVLASHDAATADRVRRETAEGIAAAIENPVVVESYGTHAERDVMRRAATIAREAGR